MYQRSTVSLPLTTEEQLMNNGFISESEVRAVLLADGWHECASIDFADGLYSSTFEAGTISLQGDTSQELTTFDGYRFTDESDAVHCGPLSAIISLRVLPESLYVASMKGRKPGTSKKLRDV
jgi:hypothetical protein